MGKPSGQQWVVWSEKQEGVSEITSLFVESKPLNLTQERQHGGWVCRPCAPNMAATLAPPTGSFARVESSSPPLVSG